MNLWYSAGIWLLGWISIIILRAISLIAYKNMGGSISDFNLEIYSKEMIEDGNNLFATGFAYMLLSLLCFYVSIFWLRLIIIILLILSCVPSMICFLMMSGQLFTRNNIHVKLMTLTAFLNTTIPLFMAINLYFLTLA